MKNNDNKIKKFIDCYIPVTTCNLRCDYCYITQVKKFDDSVYEFSVSTDLIAKALNKKRWGGTLNINLCGGGETLLPKEMPSIIEAILKEGHYVMVVTNGITSKRFDEIIQIDKELLKRLFFKFSFHYLELKRLNKLDSYFNNIDKIKNAGCSFSVEITPNDELIPYIDEIKEISLNRIKALPHITVARNNRMQDLPILTDLDKEDYKKVWGQFDSRLFDFKIKVFGEKRNEFCYGGDWTYSLNLGTGDLTQCYQGKFIQNIYEDIDKPIKKKPVGNKCPESHCYNAHAWLTFGAIPSLSTPTYNDMRDRVCLDSSHWVNENTREFFNSKLEESNKKYSPLKEFIINNKDKWRKLKNKFKK